MLACVMVFWIKLMSFVSLCVCVCEWVSELVSEWESMELTWSLMVVNVLVNKQLFLYMYWLNSYYSKCENLKTGKLLYYCQCTTIF